MKYVLMDSEIRNCSSRSDYELNIGDMMQSVAIENLYYQIGIDDSQIVHMTLDELKTYKGERLIFTFNYMICDGNRCPYIDSNGNFIFSDDIYPVFIGFSIKKGYFKFTEENLSYLKLHEPIGCRDYCTYNTLVDKGIEAYIGGCITATLPQRGEHTDSKVYLVEVPKSIEKYIPKELKENAEIVFHQKNITDEDVQNGCFSREYAKNQLEMYKNDAKLVVCSRLHAALPCLASGIPTIVVKEYFGYPFDLVKKFTHLYRREEFAEIEWKKCGVEFEEYKKIAIECARKRLLFLDAKDEIKALHNQYKDLYIDGYIEEKMRMSVFVENIHKRFQKNDAFKYALWGITDNAEWIYQYITATFPNAELVKVIDAFKRHNFHGIDAESPDILLDCEDYITIATTINVCAVAEQMFLQIGKTDDNWIAVTDGVLKEI